MRGEPLRYRYRAISQHGDLTEGTLEAGSLQEAAELLWSRGLTPFDTTLARPADNLPWWRREIGRPKAPPAKAVASFTRAFAVLCDAGLALDATLRLLAAQTVSRPMKAVAEQLHASVLEGSSVSEALRGHPRVFGPDYLSIMRAGEQRGKIGEAMAEIADLLERRIAIGDRIRSALIYPCILLVMAAVSVVVIMGVLIPSIAPVFAENGQDMPTLIVFFQWVSDHWRTIGTFLLLAVLALTAVLYLCTRYERGRLMLSQAALVMPIVGEMLLNHHTERFARTLGSLLRAGVPMVQAYTGATDVVQSRALRASLGRALEDLQDGADLADALRTHSALPESALHMIAIGESSARLEAMLQLLVANMAYVVQQRTERLMTMLTPVLTVLIAGIIGGLVFTTMNAVLSINDLALR